MKAADSFIHEFDSKCYEQYYFDQNENIEYKSYYTSDSQEEQALEQEFCLDDLEMMFA
ncbi:MAG: hypothetical protein HQL46_15890 [Gammaproteobacteria bacterium]|nr:hypothetical protein [Gammaproteobacteria bacterium]